MFQKLMDRALKERVIGAVVLVIIAVLVVPVFLDGPSTDAEIISEAVTLPGQNGQPRKQQTIVLERDRDRPVPASARQNGPNPAVTASAGSDKPENVASSEPEPQSPPPQPDTEPQAEAGTSTASAPPENEPALSAAPGTESTAESGDEASADASSDSSANSATGMWAVQLGSFSNKANAEKLAADLRDQGFAAFLSQWQSDSGQLHRVRVGPQKNRESAEAVAAKLRAEGLKGQVVPHP